MRPEHLEPIAWLILLLPIIPLACFGLLALDLFSHNIPLRERVGLAMRDALAALAGATLAANVLFDLGLSPGTRFAIVVLILVSLSVPSAIWIWLYMTGRFR